MPRVGRKLRRWTARILDLPQDVVLDLPRVTMIGGVQLTVENHRGVLHFSPGSLRLAMERGELEVTGKNLVIRTIGAEEVLVEGEITGVQLRSGSSSGSTPAG
ncbi:MULTISPECIES: sporulation protein YqfC [Cohnella]|jgi:sporulation protein YqfC|uniref:sporulation protein YqfC n=1 Tax=Cohnella TaxID=329857 RepID=UPI0003693323|nr:MULTISPECIES: sporulation protein YqfC [Cohnella]REK61088.1 MAG: sporulation protein YqfC [Cohnella sp.]